MMNAEQKRPIRVLMVVRQYHPWIGGTERQAHKLSTKLIELGVDVRVATGWWYRGTPRHEVIGSVPVDRNFALWAMFGVRGLRKLGSYLYLASLTWYLWRRRHAYDLIHIHLLNHHAFPAVLAGRWWGKKTLVKLANSGRHSDFTQINSSELPGQRWMLPTILQADRFIALSAESADELRGAGVPDDRIVRLPNGVDLPPPVRRDKAQPQALTVTFIGRMHPQKGVDVLLAAWPHVLRRQPALPWQLWIVGDGKLRPEMEAMARRLGIAERVRFWGQVAKVDELLAQSDLFVLPSRSEGMSNALLEAMAHGLPCVVSDLGGTRDMIEPDANGLLVTPDDPDRLAEALARLGGDPALRARLGAAARATIEARYSLDSVARRYIELYRGLLQQPEPAADASPRLRPQA